MITEQEVKTVFPNIDSSTAANVADAANANGIESIDRLAAVVAKATEIIRYVAEIAREAGEQIKCTYYSILRAAATPKEWHLMHHAKRRRTRKKYEHRIARRTAALLGGRCT